MRGVSKNLESRHKTCTKRQAAETFLSRKISSLSSGRHGNCLEGDVYGHKISGIPAGSWLGVGVGHGGGGDRVRLLLRGRMMLQEEGEWSVKVKGQRERERTRWSNMGPLAGVREWVRGRNHGGRRGVNIWWWSNDSNAQHAQFYAAHQREYKRWALMQMHSEDTKWEPPEIKQAIYRRFLLPFIITAGNVRGLYCKNINN